MISRSVPPSVPQIMNQSNFPLIKLCEKSFSSFFFCLLFFKSMGLLFLLLSRQKMLEHFSISTSCDDVNIFSFLDASSHLYKRVCLSVRPSVRPSAHPSIRYAFSKIAEIRHGKCVNLIQRTISTVPVKPQLTQLPPLPLTPLP